MREFVLLYARADDIKDQLSQLLGAESPTQMPMAGMTPEQMQQQQQMMQQQMQMQMQMQQQQMQMQQGQPGQPQPPGRVSRRPRRGNGMTGPQKEEPVRMIVNRRRNSILVQAPPDKMAIIADAVKLLDVQDDGAAFAAGVSGPHAGVSAGPIGSAEAGGLPAGAGRTRPHHAAGSG